MQGYKTYIVAVLMVIYAVSAYFLGKDPEFNIQMVLEALGLSALRAGVAKVR